MGRKARTKAQIVIHIGAEFTSKELASAMLDGLAALAVSPGNLQGLHHALKG